MVLVGSKPSFQTGGAKTPPGQPALLHYLNSNGNKIPSGRVPEKTANTKDKKSNP
jgi:hypothetical protein